MGCLFAAIFGVVFFGFFGAAGVGLYYLLKLAKSKSDRQ